MGTGLFGRRRPGKKLQHIEFLDQRHPKPAVQAPAKTLAWDRATDRFPPGFYTYRLIDPATDLAFYVGKGQRGRAWQHERAVVGGDLSGNWRKVAKIQDILRRGDEVVIDIVACYELESDALDHEFRLVDSNPTLTNMAPGGGGAPLSQAAQARKLAVRIEKMRRLRERERQGRVNAAMMDRRSEFTSRATGPRQQAEVQDWLNSLSPEESEKVLAPRHYGARMGALTSEARRKRAPRPISRF